MQHHETEREPALQITDLTVSYENKPVLWDIDLDIKSGTLMGIVGPNGAGKTTLIKAIQGLVTAAAGRVFVYGLPYEKNRKLVAYVPQRGTVDWDFPTSVIDVVKMGSYGKLGWLRRPGKSEHKKAVNALSMVGMSGYEERQISNLSGGQQQRVFLARALIQDAEIYLLDEPFQGVDATTEKEIIKILKKLRDRGKTVVVVHHDLQTVKEYFDWVTLLNVKIVSTGRVEEVFTSENIDKTYGGRVEFIEDIMRKQKATA